MTVSEWKLAQASRLLYFEGMVPLLVHEVSRIRLLW